MSFQDFIRKVCQNYTGERWVICQGSTNFSGLKRAIIFSSGDNYRDGYIYPPSAITRYYFFIIRNFIKVYSSTSNHRTTSRHELFYNNPKMKLRKTSLLF